MIKKEKKKKTKQDTKLKSYLPLKVRFVHISKIKKLKYM